MLPSSAIVVSLTTLSSFEYVPLPVTVVVGTVGTPSIVNSVLPYGIVSVYSLLSFDKDGDNTAFVKLTFDKVVSLDFGLFTFIVYIFIVFPSSAVTVTL